MVIYTFRFSKLMWLLEPRRDGQKSVFYCYRSADGAILFRSDDDDVSPKPIRDTTIDTIKDIQNFSTLKVHNFFY